MVGSIEGELENKNRLEPIVNIENGSHLIQLCLNRYISEPDDIDDSVLYIEFGVNSDEGIYTIDEAEIKIKYCPFCGEEL
jgi:hypothetical protein